MTNNILKSLGLLFILSTTPFTMSGTRKNVDIKSIFSLYLLDNNLRYLKEVISSECESSESSYYPRNRLIGHYERTEKALGDLKKCIGESCECGKLNSGLKLMRRDLSKEEQEYLFTQISCLLKYHNPYYLDMNEENHLFAINKEQVRLFTLNYYRPKKAPEALELLPKLAELFENDIQQVEDRQEAFALYMERIIYLFLILKTLPAKPLSTFHPINSNHDNADSSHKYLERETKKIVTYTEIQIYIKKILRTITRIIINKNKTLKKPQNYIDELFITKKHEGRGQNKTNNNFYTGN